MGRRIARRLLALLPPDVRGEYTGEVIATLGRRRVSERGAGLRTGVRFWTREILGLARFVATAWMDTWRASGRRRVPRTDRWLVALRWGWRSVRRAPAFYALTALTLGLGLGANAGVLGVASRVLLQELPYEDADRLVRAYHHFVGDDRFGFSINEVAFYESRARTLEALAPYVVTGVNLTGEGGATRILAARVGTGFFSVLGVPPTSGRTFRASDAGEPSIVISSGFHERYFGADAEAVGARVVLDDVTHAVIGTMPSSFTFPDGEVDIWLPRPRGRLGAGRGNVGSEVIARLSPGASVEAASAELDRLAQQMAGQFPEDYRGDRDWGAHVEPFRDAEASTSTPLILPLVAAVLGVLLVTALNVGSLLLIRSDQLRSALSIRRALGALPRDLLRLVGIDVLALTVLGVAVAIPLGGWLHGALAFLVPGSLSGGSPFAWEGIALVGGLVLSVAGTLGGISWLKALAVPAAATVRNTRSDGPRSGRLLHTLCVIQVGVAIALTATAGLVLRSVEHLVAVDLGYDVDGVTSARITLPRMRYPEGPAQWTFFAELEERLRDRADIEAVGVGSALPLSGFGGGGDVSVEELGADSVSTGASQRTVTPGYFAAAGIPLVAGRFFDLDDRAGRERVAVVDTLFAARVFGSSEAAVGRRIQFFYGGDEWNEIVGVVGHVRHADPAQLGNPHVYVPFAQRPTSGAHLVVRSPGDLDAVVSTLRQETAALDASVPLYDVATLAERLSAVVERERTASLIFGAFGLLTLALAIVGVYAAVSLTSAQRAREYGIRQALGANRTHVLGSVLRSGLTVLGLGALMGAAIVFLTRPALSGLLFGVTAADPAVWVGTLVSLTGTGIVACLVPALRAVRADPSQVMSGG